MNSIVLPYFSAASRLAGAVDYLDPHVGIRGWVVDPEAPGMPLALEARCRGQVLARSVAVVDRPDIDTVLGRTTQCGFLIGWSRFDLATLEKLSEMDELDFVISGLESQIPVVRDPILVGDCLAYVRAAPKGDRGRSFNDLNDYLEIDQSGVFDADWYARNRPELALGMPPLLEYLRAGEAAGASPSLYFDPRGYAQEAQLAAAAGSLVHYIRNSAVTGLAPSIHFDARWYRATYKPSGALPLADYMARRCERGPNRWFDPAWYVAQCAGARLPDPYEHFITVGLAAGTPPSAEFDKPAASQPKEGVAFLAQLRRWQEPGGTEQPTPAAKAKRSTAKPAPKPVAVAEPTPQRALPMAAAIASPGAVPKATTIASPAALPKAAVIASPAALPKATTIASAAALPKAAVIASPGAVPKAATIASSAALPKAATIASPTAPGRQLASPPPAVPRIVEPARPAPAAGRAAATGEPGRPLEAGYAGTEAWLRGLPKPERDAVLSHAERDMEAASGPQRAEAALVVAVARNLAGDRLGCAAAQLAFLAAAEPKAVPALAEIESRFAGLNHTLYEARNRAEAVEVYRHLHRRGFKDILVSLRLLEIALDAGDLSAAAPYAAELEREHSERLNVWGFLALSRYHHLNGQIATSALILRGLPPYPQTEAIAEAVIAHRLIEAGEFEVAASRLEVVGESAVPEVFQARFRLAVKRGTLAGFLEQHEQRCAAEVADWLLGEAMFTCVSLGTVASTETQQAQRLLYQVLLTRGLESRPVVQARIHYLLYLKRWDELGALFRALEGGPLATDRETLLRKLEFYCHADNADGAEEIYQATFVGTTLNKWESLTILRLLSELKRWEEAGRVLQAHVASGFGFSGAGHTAMRIVRKAGVHQLLLDTAATAASKASRRDGDLDDFLHLVNEDQVIVNSARAMTANLQVGSSPARYRSNWLLTSGEANGQHADLCLFLCTNQRYFLSLLTFLSSFLGQSPQVGGRIFVFLDRDVPRHWYGSIAMVAARFNRAIDIIPEDEFMPNAVDHRVEYGFFAGGAGLSRAAYFRLYAARYLLDRFSFSRAVYTDTDIVCRGDMSGMFDLDLGDKVLAARVEDYSPEVINAAGRNNIDPRAYFNSGVLLLKFDDARLGPLIDEAIRVSEQEPERLVFHDQCALNIAFQHNFAALPDRYNFFLRPSRERNGFIEDGVLLHYLDKPKPWDIVFDRSYREEWRVWALVLGSILPQGLYVDIFAAGNRD